MKALARSLFVALAGSVGAPGLAQWSTAPFPQTHGEGFAATTIGLHVKATPQDLLIEGFARADGEVLVDRQRHDQVRVRRFWQASNYPQEILSEIDWEVVATARVGDGKDSVSRVVGAADHCGQTGDIAHVHAQRSVKRHRSGERLGGVVVGDPVGERRAVARMYSGDVVTDHLDAEPRQ